MNNVSEQRNFKVLGINHIGLAAKDPSKAQAFFTVLLGLAHLGDELVRDQHTLTTMISSTTESSVDVQSRLEILANEVGHEGPIASFIAKRGGGIHHLALAVDHIEAAITHLSAHGVRMIDKQPRNGAHRTRIAFVHPESTGGLLVELVEDHG